jgi:hypothetical protein
VIPEREKFEKREHGQTKPKIEGGYLKVVLTSDWQNPI